MSVWQREQTRARNSSLGLPFSSLVLWRWKGLEYYNGVLDVRNTEYIHFINYTFVKNDTATIFFHFIVNIKKKSKKEKNLDL